VDEKRFSDFPNDEFDVAFDLVLVAIDILENHHVIFCDPFRVIGQLVEFQDHHAYPLCF
jgi:hypothetical protein